MPKVELLIEGNIDDVMRGFYINWDLPVVLDIPTLSQTQLRIPLNDGGRVSLVRPIPLI